jgi:putative spermidine/putrescine transport system substrate-binding protein
MTKQTAGRHRAEVDEACDRLRLLLEETRHASRREFLRILRGSAVLATLPRVMSGTALAAEQPVTAFVFGGVWKRSAAEAFGEPFTRQTGIPMQYQEPYTFARLRAMHEAKAQQIDVVSLQGNEIIVAGRLHMLMPLDWTVIDRSALSDRQLRHPDAIGSHTLSYVVCYNKKKWPGAAHPSSWADFWDVDKFPGRRVLRRDPIWTMEAALKADGVKESEFYPLDVERALRTLDRIRPHVKSWYVDNSQAQQLMEQEEVDLIAMVNGRATESIRNHGAPFEIVWNEAICEGGLQGWAAPVGCPNPKGAMRFLDFVGRAEYEAAFARLMFYSPQNPKAFDLLPLDLAKVMPTYPENEKLAHIINYDWWAGDGTAVQRRFERWLQS